MEEWIRERGYVMWLGALGAAADSEEEPRAQRERSKEERVSTSSRRDERPAVSDEAWLPR